MARTCPRVPLAVGAALMVWTGLAQTACGGARRPTQAVAATDRHGDPLPARVVSRLGTLRLLHHASVIATAFSADGRRFASASADRTVVVWSWPDGRALHTLELARRPSAALPNLVFAPNGRFLAAVAEGVMTVWDLTTGEIILSRAALPGPAFTPDGSRLAWRVSLHAVCIRDLAAGKEDVVYKRTDRALAVALDADGTLLLAEGRPDAVVLCDVVQDKDLHTIEMRDLDAASWAQFIPGGDCFAMQTRATGARLIDVRQRKELGRVPALTVEDVPIALSADGRRLLVGRAKKDTPMHLWDLEQGKEACTVHAYAGEGVQRSGAFSPDGKLLALGGTNHPHAAGFWDTRAGERAEVLAGHGAPLCSVRFSPDGREVATCAAVIGEPTVRIWEAATGRLLRSFPAHRYGVLDVAYTPDGTKLITCGLWGDEDICVWDARTLQKQMQLKAHRHGAGYVAVAPDGQRFVSVGAGKTPEDLVVWDLKAGTQLYTHATLGQSVQGIAFLSPRSLLLCNWLTLQRWDLGAPAALGERTIGSGDGLRMDVAVDGRLAAVGERRAPTPVRLLETLSGQQVARFDVGQPCSALAIAPDGRTIAAGTTTGEICLLDPVSGQTVLALPAYRSTVNRLAFSPDGKRLVSSGGGIESATALVWDVADVTHRSLKPAQPSDRDLDQWCKALLGTDAAAAYQAAAQLRGVPRRAVSALKPVIAAHAKSAAPAIRAWIEDLDSDVFDVRDQAHDALLRAGKGAVAQIVKALGSNPSVEQRVRLKQILNIVGKQPVSVEQLTASRIVMVLEWIASAEARALLDQLAKGDRDAALTEEARASLARLALGKQAQP